MARNSRSCALKALGRKPYLLPREIMDVAGMFIYLIAGFPKHPSQRTWKNLLAVSLGEIVKEYHLIYGRRPNPSQSLARLLAIEMNGRTAALQMDSFRLLSDREIKRYIDEGQVNKDWLRGMGVRFRSRRGVLTVMVQGEVVAEVDVGGNRG